jgi:hypothetical protein
MSLTSYRAAPPREDQSSDGRWQKGRAAAAGPGLWEAGRDQQKAEGGRQRAATRAATGRGASAIGPLRSALLSLRAPGSTWRRPALPPLLGAVPWARRSFTAEFGMDRVGPPRCGHQVEPGVQRSEIRGQRSESLPGRPGRRAGEPKLGPPDAVLWWVTSAL